MTLMVNSRVEHGAGMPIFWPRPTPLRVAKIALVNRTKWGEPVRCGVMQGRVIRDGGCGLCGDMRVFNKNQIYGS
jgi:hypothetical protein